MHTTKTVKIETNIRLVSQVFNSHNNNIINISSCVQKKAPKFELYEAFLLFLCYFFNLSPIFASFFHRYPQPLCSILQRKSSAECLLFERECTFYTFYKRHRRGGTGPVFLSGGADVCEISKIAVTEAEIAGDSLGIGRGGAFAGGASQHICIRILIVILL